MTAQKTQEAVNNLVYLISCTVNGRELDQDRVFAMDLSSLYEVAEFHLLTGITAMALESVGIRNEEFTQAKGKAIRKVAAMDLDRIVILDRFEEKGIWYLPLKGAVLKDLYPQIGMRQMSDNDILIDGSKMKDAEAIMKDLSFTCGHRNATHMVFYKPPVSNFELHTKLFRDKLGRRFRRYYKNVKARLIKDEDKQLGYHFSDEDFYVYMIAHEYKHYMESGTGLRSLLDSYIYCQKLGDGLDWVYIEEETGKLGIAEFERENRMLSLHLFGGESLTEDEKERLEYIVFSGAYGTMKHRITNTVNKYGGGMRGKIRYVVDRIFLSMDDVRAVYPLFAKIPILLPFLPVYRLAVGIIFRRKNLANEWVFLIEE